MTTIDVKDDWVHIYATYEEKDICKSISSRKWNPEPEAKRWESPVSIIHEVISKFPNALLTNDAKITLEKLEKLKIMASNPNGISKIPVKEGLNLYPFQVAGVEFLNMTDGKAIVADEMGLGKTCQALAYAYNHPEQRPVVVICPASLKTNWAREAKKWLSDKDTIQVVDSKEPTSGSSIYIINYDRLKKHSVFLQLQGFRLGILDESHAIKNYKAKRTQLVQSLMSGIPHRILLTGTPILNKPSELFTQINIVDPHMFYNFFKYAERYCNARKTAYGLDTSGSSNIPELNDRIKTFTIRRLKNQVLTELPDKIRTTIEFDLDNRQDYFWAEKNINTWIRVNKGQIAADKALNAEMLVKVENLKQLSVKGKLSGIFDWIDDFMESGEKLVIFATHTDIIQTIIKRYPNESVFLTGECSADARQRAIDNFQTNPNIKLFVGNIQAAGVGITLTAASNVAFIELGWTPSVMSQAEDRCHRIGQKSAVNIYYLLGKDTIDKKIAEILMDKSTVIDAIIDGKEAPELNIMKNLVNHFNVDIDRANRVIEDRGNNEEKESWV